MTTTIGNQLDILTEYKEHQVVVNTYDIDGALCDRDGFYFEELRVFPSQLAFVRKDQSIFTIELDGSYIFYKSEDFQHHYILQFSNQRTELYFP